MRGRQEKRDRGKRYIVRWKISNVAMYAFPNYKYNISTLTDKKYFLFFFCQTTDRTSI